MKTLKPTGTPPDQAGFLLPDLVEDFLSSCRARGLSRSTVEQVYGYSLKCMFLPWCAGKNLYQVDQLNQRAVDAFTSHLLTMTTRRGKPLSRSSSHIYIRNVRQFLKWCEREGEGTAAQPQLPRLSRRVIDTLTREEIDSLENATQSERDALIVRLLADTGIRIGELCSLKVEDLRFSDRRPLLKVRGKGDKDRLVPVAPILARRVQRYVARRQGHIQRPELFLSKRRDPAGEPLRLTRSGVLQLLRTLAQRAGVTKRVHPHLFRHSFATEALRRGMNPIQLAQIRALLCVSTEVPN